MSDEFVKTEIRELTEPTDSLLKAIVEKIATYPDMISKSVVDMIARIAFAGGYSQLTRDIHEMNNEVMVSVDDEANQFMNVMWVECDKIVSIGESGVIDYDPSKKPSFT